METSPERPPAYKIKTYGDAIGVPSRGAEERVVPVYREESTFCVPVHTQQKSNYIKTKTGTTVFNVIIPRCGAVVKKYTVLKKLKYFNILERMILQLVYYIYSPNKYA